MPSELQTRLLRVLADGQFYRVGGHSPVKVNVRVIAATHQDLESRVKEGLFREDLYHRLNVIRLRLPALRERHEDIPVLAKHFLQKSARELGVETKKLSDATLKFMSGMPWTGNVRQLENVCHYLTVMAPGQVVEPKDLPPDMVSAEKAAEGEDWLSCLSRQVDMRLARGESGILDELVPAFEKALISIALKHTGGRRIEAAQLLGWGRNTLTRKIQELGMNDSGE
jgi:two-component system nitrogen regulation response regulator GlnG